MIDSKDLWYKYQGVAHSNMYAADKKYYWYGSDNEGTWKENISDPNKKQRLEELGWIDKKIAYQFNHQGFRDEEFDARPAGLAFGCSFTQGVGVESQDSWPKQLQTMLNTHVWNMGIGGSSLDQVFRLVDHYLGIFDPLFVVVCCPPQERYEIWNQYNDPEQFLPRQPSNIQDPGLANLTKTWLANENNGKFNYRKNKLAIEQLCYQKNVPVYIFNSSAIRIDKQARDLMHPGPSPLRDFAVYLYNHFLKKYRDKNLIAADTADSKSQ